MRLTLALIMALLLVGLVAAGTIAQTDAIRPATSAEAAVHALFENVKNRNFSGAYSYVAPESNITQPDFQKDVAGRDGSLRTLSTLQEVTTKLLNESNNQATVRADMKWSTAVGAFYDSRDLKVVNDDGTWRVLWQAEPAPTVPPQVIPVNYLRWDVIRRGADDDWGAQNVEAPRVRIVSMNAIERDGAVVILGEIVNEDTIPGFVSVAATLIGQNGETIGEESSFDKMSHTLLPKEVSPFRIDFPGAKLAQVKNVRMQPNALLVPASADPVIGVLNQRVEKLGNGSSVLKGELVNQSGTTVNIPHVLAAFYDDSGKVIWVTDGYVDKALLPQTPVSFGVALGDDIATRVRSYRVTVNHYTLGRS